MKKIRIKIFILILIIGSVVSCEKEESNLNIYDLVAVWKLDKFIDKNNNILHAPETQISFLSNNCVTVFTSYNYGQGEFSINGDKVTMSNLVLSDREYDLENDNRFVSNLTGSYLIYGDTLRILSDHDFDMIFHKTQIVDPYQCNLSTLLIDTIENNRYYPEDIFDEKYSSIYGKWFVYFEDGGWGEVAPYFDFYEFKENGIYGISKGSNLLDFGRIDIIRTISEEKIALNLIPNNNSNPQALFVDRMFIFQGKDSIVIGSCVGCSQHLCRVK